jgi:hypothetical protein
MQMPMRFIFVSRGLAAGGAMSIAVGLLAP